VEPWSFDQARTACRDASVAQAAVEKDLVKAFRDYAAAEERYRIALAKQILDCHVDGIAWSTAPDIARGDKTVAALRRERDIAEGLKEALVQAAWRRNADRKDAQRFSDWSQRRELAEFHGRDPEGSLV
jgi:rubrerythrin